MKNKIITLSICFFLIFSNLKSQDYDLNNYKFRYQNYKALTGSVNLNSNSSNNNDKYKDNDTIIDTQNKSDYNDRNFNYSINANYTARKSTDAMQMERNFSFSSDAQLSNRGNGKYLNDSLLNSSQNNSKYYNHNLSYNQLHRLYKPNNTFSLISFEIIAGHSGSSTDNDYNDGNSTRNRLGSTLTIGKGKGRLEYVTDAATAMFIIQDLQKKAGLGKLTNEQTEIIAKGITTAKNTRFIDFRYRLIDQIAMLDSFFTIAGIKPKNELAYYTTLYDNWFYANRFNRLSGKRFTAAISNSNYYDHSKNYSFRPNFSGYSKEYNTLTQNTTSLSFEYIKSEQASLNLQKSYSIFGNSFLIHQTDFVQREDSTNTQPFNKNETKTKPDNISTSIGLNYNILFQPNTRNYYTFGITETFYQINSLLGLRKSNQTNISSIDRNLNTQLSFSYFHFFSPRLSFSANAQGNFVFGNNIGKNDIQNPGGLFKYKRTNNNLGFGGTLIASLNYAIF